MNGCWLRCFIVLLLLLLLFDVTFEQKIHNLSSLSLQPTRSLFPNGFRVEDCDDDDVDDDEKKHKKRVPNAFIG